MLVLLGSSCTEVTIQSDRQRFVFSSHLLGHVLERLGQMLLAERKLANGPDFRILPGTYVVSIFNPIARLLNARTGFRFFLISMSRVPALMAMISGAASGSWAIGEPHSEQNIR